MKTIFFRTCVVAVFCLGLFACGKSDDEAYKGIKLSKALAEGLLKYQEEPFNERAKNHGLLGLREVGEMLVLPYYHDGNLNYNGTAFMNEKGEVAFYIDNVRYERVDTFCCGIARMLNEDKEWGCVNTEGEMIVPFGKYQYVEDYRDGYALFLRDDKFGFLNTKGEETLYTDYDNFAMMDNGMCFLLRMDDTDEGGRATLYKSNGEVALEEGVANYAIGTKDVVFVRTKSDKWMVVDAKGDKRDIDVEGVAELKDGWTDLLLVAQNGKVGLYDSKGGSVVPCEYDDVEALFSNENVKYLKLQKNGKWGVANLEGEELWPCEFEEVYDCSETLISAKKDAEHAGVFDKKGKILCDVRGARVYDNLAPVIGPEGVGLQNENGKIIVPFNRYRSASSMGSFYADFHLLKLRMEEEYAYYNTLTGEEVFRGSDGVFDKYGIAQIYESKSGELNYGVIDKTGKVIVPVGDYWPAACGKVILVSSNKRNAWTKIYDMKGKVLLDVPEKLADDLSLFLDGYYFSTEEGNTYFINGDGKTFSIPAVLKNLKDRDKRDPKSLFFGSRN